MHTGGSAARSSRGALGAAAAMLLVPAGVPSPAGAQVQWTGAFREVTAGIHASGACLLDDDCGGSPFSEQHSVSDEATGTQPWVGSIALSEFPDFDCGFLCDAHAAVTQDSAIGAARVDLASALVVGGSGFFGPFPSPFVARGGGDAGSLAQVTFYVGATTPYRLAGELRSQLTIAGGDPDSRYRAILWEGPFAGLPAATVEYVDGGCPGTCPPLSFERTGTLPPGTYTLDVLVEADATAVPDDLDAGTVAYEVELDAVLELEPPAPSVPALPAPLAVALAAALLAVAARRPS